MTSYPALGVYSLRIDGGVLALVLDAGHRELSHPRRLPGTPWVVATRYGQDPDRNGLALEDEAPLGASYLGTEIVVFRLDAPQEVFVLAGSPSTGFAANPSWTEDGRVLYLHADAGAPEIRRLRLDLQSTPTVVGGEVLALPPGLVVPVDPHQWGPSTTAGRLVFSALFSTAQGWTRPVWQVPATGTSSWAETRIVGCPLCPLQNGCCTFASPEAVLGTNDARINHHGSVVTWMQQSPELSFPFGAQSVHPYRQVSAPLDGGPQMTLVTPAATPATTLNAYPEWSPDDARLVSWVIEITNPLRHHLELMNPDGTGRVRLALPVELCPQHPSFLDDGTLIFNARRAAADAGYSCAVALLSP